MYNFNKIIRNYTLGGIGQNFVYALITGAYLFYFTEAGGLSAASVGIILLVVRIVCLFLDPNVAILIEKTNTRWGKYKPYLVTMPLVISLLLVALFYHPSISDGLYLVYVYTITILFWIAYAFFDISYWSLLPSITRDEAKRVKLLTVCKLGTTCAMFVLGIFRMPVVNLLGKGNYGRGFLFLAIILATIFTIFGVVLSRTFSMISGNGIKETKKTEKLAIKEMLKALKGNKPLLTMVLAKLSIYISVSVKLSLVIYFYKYQLGNDSLGSFSSMLALPLTLLFLSSCPKLLKKYDNRKVMTEFLIIQFVLSILYILNTGIFAFYIVIDGISNTLLGGFSLIFTNMTADCVEYGEWNSQTRTESVVFSVNTISSKLATGLSGALAGWILTGIGYKPEANQTKEMLGDLHYVLVFVPAIGVLLGIIILRKYVLTTEMYRKIVEDLSKGKYGKE